jgi:hypothetical protein
MNFNEIPFDKLKQIPDPNKFARQFKNRVYSFGSIEGSVINIYTYVYINKEGVVSFSHKENVEMLGGGLDPKTDNEIFQTLFDLSFTYQSYRLKYLGNHYEN